MTNKRFRSIEEVDDINTLDEYQVTLGQGFDEAEALQIVAEMSRDNARTPMQWSSDLYAGFSKAVPWLRENDNYREINVAEQEGRADSVLSFYKKLIALRTDPVYTEAVVYGEQIPVLEEETNFIGFYRKGAEKTLLVLANYRKEKREVTISQAIKKVIIDNCEDRDCREHLIAKTGEGSRISMEGYQFLVVEVEN